MHDHIRERLAKKGLLRKLMDNLTSHRNKIYEAVLENNKIVMSSHQPQHKHAGLIFLDYLISSIYKDKKGEGEGKGGKAMRLVEDDASNYQSSNSRQGMVR